MIHGSKGKWKRSWLMSMLALALLFAAAPPRVAAQGPSADAFERAVDAYNNNRFTEAQSLFSGVAGMHAPEAGTYLEKIRTYKEALETAQTMLSRSPDEMDNASLDLAIRQIQQALSIKADGPYHPNDLLAKAKELKATLAQRDRSNAASRDQDLCNKALEASKAERYEDAQRFSCLVAYDNPGFQCGGDEAANVCQEMKDLLASRPGGTSKPAPRSHDADAFEKAKSAYDGNDFDAAGKLFQQVTDQRQSEASKYLDKINRYQTAMKQALAASHDGKYEEARAAYQQAESVKPGGPGNPEEQVAILDLEQGIDEFYSGHYAEAQDRLLTYNRENPKRADLAHFYIGASKLAQFYLAGGHDTTLHEGALDELRAARKAGFSPRGQPVSPRILNEYEQVPE